MSTQQTEPGSFRDRHGRVFYENGKVLRGLSQKALGDWETLQKTQFFPQAQANGRLVRSELLEQRNSTENWAGVLQHETIPFISYPYEWCFSMLKDAALLHLELLSAALKENMVLKDSSAFNVQWKGKNPVFIDIPSFETLEDGEPWVGYRQFCQMFLHPLMLQSYKNVDFHTWLRGDIDGIMPSAMTQLMGGFTRFKRGVLTHVVLQARLEKKHAHTQKDVKSDLKKVGFNKRLIEANVEGLTGLIKRLTWDVKQSEWADYTDLGHYSDRAMADKQDFVRKVCAEKRRNLVWDSGCNTGVFSRIAADHTDYVVAMDADHLAIDRLYQTLKSSEPVNNILPLVINMVNTSPALGWRGLERKTLADRGKPDLLLCLALIHHIVISANVPLEEFVEWLADLDCEVILEFVTKQDPMVKKLLQNKPDIYDDYTLDNFESNAQRYFTLDKKTELDSGTRFLYHLHPKTG
ncbi:MAG: hypothetical protein V3V31_09405 [Methylococcales bacterium]